MSLAHFLDQARPNCQGVLLSRGQNIHNDLYLDPKAAMLLGDAKDAVGKVVQELKKAA